MLKNLAALIILSLLFSCNNATQQQADNYEQGINSATDSIEQEGLYGESINVDSVISGQDLIGLMGNHDSVWVTLKAPIVANCKRTGCWMDLDLGSDEVMKVTFKDYAFVIPIDSEGKTATIEGMAKREIIPVDLLKHYAEDEGKSQEEIDAITENKIAYTFEAKGVIIND